MATSTSGTLEVLLHLLAQGSGRGTLAFLERRNAGRRGWWRSVEQILQDPLAAKHRGSAGGIGRNGEYAGVRQDAAAAIGGADIHQPELRPRNTRNPVKPGQPLI